MNILYGFVVDISAFQVQFGALEIVGAFIILAITIGISVLKMKGFFKQ
jgi:hypothetical protein